MRVKYDPDFFPLYKKASVRIRNSFDRKLLIFQKNPNDLELNKHDLKREWTGYKSIDINADWRGIYKEIQIRGKTVAYFVALGIHDQLYSPE